MKLYEPQNRSNCLTHSIFHKQLPELCTHTKVVERPTNIEVPTTTRVSGALGRQLFSVPPSPPSKTIDSGSASHQHYRLQQQPELLVCSIVSYARQQQHCNKHCSKVGPVPAMCLLAALQPGWGVVNAGAD